MGFLFLQRCLKIFFYHKGTKEHEGKSFKGFRLPPLGVVPLCELCGEEFEFCSVKN